MPADASVGGLVTEEDAGHIGGRSRILATTTGHDSAHARHDRLVAGMCCLTGECALEGRTHTITNRGRET